MQPPPVPLGMHFMSLQEVVTTECGLLELQYYDDIDAPDELTIIEHIMFAPAWSSVTGSAKWALPVCEPGREDYVCGLRELVKETPLCELRDRLWDLNEFAPDRRARDAYCAEMRAAQAGQVSWTGFEAAGRAYADVVQRRRHAQYLRKLVRDQHWYNFEYISIGVAEGEKAEQESRKRRFLKLMGDMRIRLVAAMGQDDRKEENAVCMEMKRQQMTWGFDLSGDLLGECEKAKLILAIGQLSVDTPVHTEPLLTEPGSSVL
ncbi:Hypothetical protein D9617_5g070000 [Elsinoe fawcettii]|nr:Hypothetical protein D9617_5g070000 [Elsinoe fawcettii]